MPLDTPPTAARRAAGAVLMVRPAAFARNEVTAPTNRFQSAHGDPEVTAAAAIAEFDSLAAVLREHGVEVHVFPGRTTTELPDEVFPNNWISTHPDGTVVLYPMMAWNRRPERRRDILEQLQTLASGFRIARLVDLSALETAGHYLEGTGSLVFDHENRLAYACLSPRTHAEALREFAERADYDVISFETRDANGHAVYHTNVLMSLGEDFALVCLESIPAVDDRLRVLGRLERSGREVIEISLRQMRSFAGNLLQLRAGNRRLIVMSDQARAALDDTQLDALGRHADTLVSVDVTTIEANGGGSVRCMLAELLLPRKTGPDGLAPTD